MADSPFIISDNGSIGAGKTRQEPIVVTATMPYTAMLGTIPLSQVVWFRVAISQGYWKFGTAADVFVALFKTDGKLIRRGADFIEASLPSGFYLLAVANSSATASDNFGMVAGSGYGVNPIPSSTVIQAIITASAPKVITPAWVKSLPSFKRAIFCPAPQENQTPESIRITASSDIKLPTMLVDFGLLSRVFGVSEPTFNIGGGSRRFIDDDEGEEANLGDRYRPDDSAFFSRTFASPAAIRLNLNQSAINGIKAVIGLSFRRPFGSLTEGQASNCIIVELLNPQGQTIVTAKGGVGLEAFIKGSPNKVYNATASGSVIGNEASDKFSAPAFRALAIIVAPDGRVAVGTHHPDFITEFQDFKIYYNYTCHHGGYPEIGQLSPADMVISAIRVTVSKTCGMTYADIHLPNIDAANLNEGGWWQDKHFVREEAFDLSSTLTENDWNKTPI